MSDAIWAARLGDGLEHTSMMADIVGGVLEVAATVAIGALATAAVVAATGITVATGGIGACLLGAVVGLVVGVVMAKTGADTGLSRLCEGIGNGLFPPTIQATISTGSLNTRTNNLLAARAAGWVPPGVELVEQDGEAPEASYLDMASNFFSQMWRPTVATPAPGAQPLPEDLVLCSKHPPMPPQFLAEGSAKVTINGQPAVRSGDRSTCEAVVVSAGPISSNVRIGGEKLTVREIRSGKTPGVGLAVSVLMMLKGSKGKFLSNLPCMALGMVNGFVVGEATGAMTRAMSGSPNPVHAATGAKVLSGGDELDFVLPGILPIEWQRVYNSRDERQNTLFGLGWSVAFEVCVAIEPHPEGGERLVYTDEQGRRIDMGSIPLGGAVFSVGEGLSVRRHARGQLLIESEDGLYRLFEPSPLDASLLRLSVLGDRNDNRIHLDYDEQGRLSGLRDGLDNVRLALVHSLQWPQRLERIERLHADESRTLLARYDYDAQGQLSEVCDALGQVQRRFAYDSGRRMVEHQLPTGLRCFYDWALIDTREWRVVRHWTDEGDEYLFDYDLDAGLTRITDGLQRVSERRWNARRQITAYTDNLGQTWQFEWNDEDQWLGATDPLGGQWQFSYDDAGNLSETRDPLGQTESTRWLEHWSLPLSETDKAGGLWQYRYDQRGNCTREIDPLGHETRYRHDAQGQVIEIIDASGRSRHQRWSAIGQLLQHTDCSGYATDYAYDRHGHLCSVTDALGERTLHEHDVLGRLLRIEQPDGRVEHFQRERSGLLTGYVDPAGHATRYGWNRRGQVRQRIDALGHQVQFDYDRYGRLQTLSNENGEPYRFAWDAGDRLIEQQALDRSVQCFAYDAADRLIEHRHIPAPQADGAQPLVQRLERDALGRLIARTTADGLTAYRYTAQDLPASIMFTGHGGQQQNLEFRYDALGQLREERSAAGSLRHEYDELGNLIRTQTPDGRWLNRLYYGSGHLHQINLDGRVISDFERDRLHREVLRTQGQISTASQYDRSGRLRARLRRPTQGTVRGATQLPAQRESQYDFDPADNLIGRLQRDRHAQQDQRQHLHYDASGRIAASQQSPGSQSETFAWDAAANLLDRPLSGAGFVRHNQLLTWQDKRYRYDAFGRTVEKRSARHGLQRFAYDAEHQLVEVQNDNGSVVRMQYDPLGRRIAKTEHDRHGHLLGETRFIWDGMRLLQERKNSLSSLYVYVEDSHEPLARVDGAGDQQHIRYYHNDPNGLPGQLTDSAGKTVWQAQYQVWGNTLRETREVWYVEEQNLRFQGQYLDRETGLHYNTFRFYDPDIGRFTTPDPIGLAGGLNLYLYAPNPFGWADPWGWCPKSFRKLKSSTKGEWGKHRGRNYLESKGYKVVGEEITMRVGPKNSRIRADLVGYNPATQKFMVLETKAGPFARLTKNQKASGVFSAKHSTLSQGAELSGPRADAMMKELGLSSNKITSDFSMQHYRVPGGLF
ncbi:RHS repeat-associated core domain-containing protein [Pseudomonas sp. 3A(2025)]